MTFAQFVAVFVPFFSALFLGVVATWKTSDYEPGWCVLFVPSFILMIVAAKAAYILAGGS